MAVINTVVTILPLRVRQLPAREGELTVRLTSRRRLFTVQLPGVLTQEWKRKEVEMPHAVYYDTQYDARYGGPLADWERELLGLDK